LEAVMSVLVKGIHAVGGRIDQDAVADEDTIIQWEPDLFRFAFCGVRLMYESCLGKICFCRVKV